MLDKPTPADALLGKPAVAHNPAPAGPRAAEAGRDGPGGPERAVGDRRFRHPGRGGPHAEEILDRRPARRAAGGVRLESPGQRRHRAGDRRAAGVRSPAKSARPTSSAWPPCRSGTMDDAGTGATQPSRGNCICRWSEMQTIQAHFQRARPRPDRRRTGDRRPDLERALQPQDAGRPDPLSRRRTASDTFENMLRETIFAATREDPPARPARTTGA